VHCDAHMGFCYKILRPPRSTPLFWFMNSTPSHYKDSSRIRSLQLHLACAFHLVHLCKCSLSSQYDFALSPMAWEELQGNFHKYPTRGYSSLNKPHSDAYNVLELERNSTRSNFFALDTEEFLVEEYVKWYLPEYLDVLPTKDEKDKWSALIFMS